MNLSDFQVVDKEFYLDSAHRVAPLLLGKYLFRDLGNNKVILGKIVETESYSQDDPASHSYRGVTPRCKPMFREGGISYVYFIYGMHYCFNIVTDQEGFGSAVLIRALEPVLGLEEMQINRKKNDVSLLTNGPSKLCQAFAIDKSDNEKCLVSSNLKILENTSKMDSYKIKQTTRIGIKDAQDKTYRYYIKGNRYVSVI